MSRYGLYLHYPFCRRSCFYCHFAKQPWQAAANRRYLENLKRELGRRGHGQTCDSVFFGGGSPSLLSETELSGVFATLRRHLAVTGDAEVTLEANPEDVNPRTLAAWRRLGVNRLSLGVQSFSAADLRYLCRPHDPAGSQRAVRQALAAGFDNISLDFIIGLPTQSRQSLSDSLGEAKRFGAAHISVYLLEGVRRSERRDPALYHHARAWLQAAGYRHYEVSNFARPGRESRHNLKYWTSRRYIGVGPAAAGFSGRRDLQNLESLDEWCQALENGRLPQRSARAWPPPLRRLVTGLRLLAGLPARHVARFPEELAWLLENGLLRRHRGRIAVAPERILLLNEILARFMP